MKIALTTIGSRGDIQPFIALGIELQKHGHSTVILTHPWAEQVVNFYGLKHIPVGDDIDINDAAKQFVENSTNNLKGFKFALTFIFRRLRNCHKDFLTGLMDFDLVIGHGIVGKAEADMLEKPFITISIETMGLQKEYWKTRNIIRETALFLTDKLMGVIFGKPYIKFRKDIGAPPLSKKDKYPYLAIVPIPLFLQKPHRAWKRKTELTGFLFAEAPKEFAPPEDLTEFINKGEKPILVTFGSMFHTHDQTLELFNVICDAVAISASRAILIMPDLKDADIEIPEYIFLTDQIPYSWLLKQVTLVVHHFGFGTTAEVLKAGLPSIPIPHIFDQKIRASKVYKSGYAHKPLQVQKITGNTLSNAIINVKNNPELRKRCQDAEKKISRENGVKKAAYLIDNYLKNYS
jgi:UDP:flavonoid glycosyltransferase YjiC (YdhE family)